MRRGAGTGAARGRGTARRERAGAGAFCGENDRRLYTSRGPSHAAQSVGRTKHRSSRLCAVVHSHSPVSDHSSPRTDWAARELPFQPASSRPSRRGGSARRSREGGAPGAPGAQHRCSSSSSAGACAVHCAQLHSARCSDRGCPAQGDVAVRGTDASALRCQQQAGAAGAACCIPWHPRSGSHAALLRPGQRLARAWSIPVGERPVFVVARAARGAAASPDSGAPSLPEALTAPPAAPLAQARPDARSCRRPEEVAVAGQQRPPCRRSQHHPPPEAAAMRQPPPRRAGRAAGRLPAPSTSPSAQAPGAAAALAAGQAAARGGGA